MKSTVAEHNLKHA